MVYWLQYSFCKTKEDWYKFHRLIFWEYGLGDKFEKLQIIWLIDCLTKDLFSE